MFLALSQSDIRPIARKVLQTCLRDLELPLSKKKHEKCTFPTEAPDC